MANILNSTYINNDNIIGAKGLKDNQSGQKEICIKAPDSLPVFSLNQTLKERDLKTDMYKASVVIPKKKTHTFRNLFLLSALIYFTAPLIKFKKAIK